MATLNDADFESKYNNATTGLFRTGQSRGIGSDDLRTLIVDIRDSFSNVLSDGVPTLEQVLAVSNDANGTTIDNLPTPTESAHAATKGYVDSEISAGDTLVADVTISSANVLTAYNTPVQVIAAPGAGKVLMILDPIIVSIDYNSAAYATNTNFHFELGQIQTTETISNLLNNTADGLRFVHSTTSEIAQAISNSALVDKAFYFAVETGNPTAGNSSVRVIVTYKVITL